METKTKNKLYEGMFLIDSSLAGSDWDGIIAAIRTILEKAESEIISIEKWDDRRLAYDIKRISRGTYILSYFRVDGGRIQDIEKSVRLSEKIMRVLILTGEHLSPEDIEKDTPALKLEKEKQEKQESQEATPETPAESASPPIEAGEAEQTEESTQIPAETTEDLQVSDVSPVSDESPVADVSPVADESPVADVSPAAEVSPVAEDVIEKQPEQDQIEGSEQADEKEQL